MNDPTSIDSCDEAFVEDLEKEFMEMAEKGDRKAVYYAMNSSVDFYCTVAGLVMAILKLNIVGRDILLKAFAKHAAPAWAKTEYLKRIKELREMREDWNDDAERLEVTL